MESYRDSKPISVMNMLRWGSRLALIPWWADNILLDSGLDRRWKLEDGASLKEVVKWIRTNELPISLYGVDPSGYVFFHERSIIEGVDPLNMTFIINGSHATLVIDDTLKRSVSRNIDSVSNMSSSANWDFDATHWPVYEVVIEGKSANKNPALWRTLIKKPRPVFHVWVCFGVNIWFSPSRKNGRVFVVKLAVY
jgi:hypothetical protein